ncbi:MAG: methyl-accepting chemotaxis protein [Oleispira sp.]|nr:methyl-accepting chemotaxis protein [Oleispira sp.]
MSIPYANKLSTRLFTPLIIIFAIVIVALLFYVPSITKQGAINSAITSAESTVRQYKMIRGYYTNNVIKKVLAGSDLKGHFNHKGDPTKIPLPATFIHDISEQLSQQGIVSLKLYSPFPFPNRQSRNLDSFADEAWKVLKKNPKQTFSKTDLVDGKQVVRVALADTMTQAGCVSCHNSHPDTPKNDWKLGDIRGVLEVQIPIDDQIAAAKQLNFTIAGMMLTALVATVTVLFILFRRIISNRLRQVAKALQQIASGNEDLSQRLNETPRDEIGIIASAFNQFVQQMESSIKEVSAQVEHLSESTAEMEKIASDSQKGAADQQLETTSVASSATLMTSTSKQIADLARSAADHSESTLTQAESGQKLVSDNSQSVETLSTSMHHAAEAVSVLEKDSQDIGGVLDVIRGIAEQTNLLALNAAIEAARAGEQGRGFAVVADEVRSLASRTQESTEEINTMIEKLQSGAKSAVQAIESGTKDIDQSLEKAQQTNKMIDSMGIAIKSIQDLNTQIALAAEEQTSTSESINNNIDNIANISVATREGNDKLLQQSETIHQSVSNINKQLKQFT